MNEREVHLKLSDVKIDNDNLDYIKMTGEICGKLRDDLVKLFAIPNVRLSLPDAENIDYLRGFIDGYGGEEPHGVMPDGFKDINEVWDKMYELKGNEA
jgi:hypothetical protein